MTVKDVRKEKRLAKKEEKKAEHAVATGGHMTAAPPASEVDEDAVAASKSQLKHKAPQTLQITSEAQMVTVLAQVVASNHLKVLQLSAIGDGLQAITKQPWNKKFKPTYGALKDFILKHPRVFSIDATDKVTLLTARPELGTRV